RLAELATDLWWSWNIEGRRVFRRLDYTLWRATAHNPVRMLWLVPQSKLEAVAHDAGFLQLYEAALAALDAARAAHHTWWTNKFGDLSGQSVGYFSAEFALHQSLPL